jgi:hypothetical protein
VILLGFRFRVLISVFCAPNCVPLEEYDNPRNEIVITRSTPFFCEFHSIIGDALGRAARTPSPYDRISSHSLWDHQLLRPLHHPRRLWHSNWRLLLPCRLESSPFFTFTCHTACAAICEQTICFVVALFVHTRPPPSVSSARVHDSASTWHPVSTPFRPARAQWPSNAWVLFEAQARGRKGRLLQNVYGVGAGVGPAVGA